MGILEVSVEEFAVACLKGRAVGVLLHGEAVYAGFIEVDAAAVPDLHGAVAHALVKEGHVGIGLGLAHLLCGDEFRVLAENAGEACLKGVSPIVDGRSNLKFLPVGGVAEVLALCVVHALEGGRGTGSPAAAVFPCEAAAYGVGLLHLVSGGEFQHVYGIESGV